MILKETILSVFDDRGTLLKWLKKVEEALKNAVLTDFSVEQISETEIKFKFTFENGDSIESPVLTLPRGEKGEQGAQGVQGKAASITIGAVATGSPNTLANVSNSGTPEDAVLNFVIPQGEQGEQGPAGPAGPTGPQGPAGPAGESTDGFGSIIQIAINNTVEDVIAGYEGINIFSTILGRTDNEMYDIPAIVHIPLTGSDSIVLDVDETGTKLTISLDAEIIAKLSRALVIPMSAPESVALVGVDTSNAQTMLTLGSGLSVSDGVISASGGGGAGGAGFSIRASSSNPQPLLKVWFADGTIKSNVSDLWVEEGVTAVKLNRPDQYTIMNTPPGILFDSNNNIVAVGDTSIVLASVSSSNIGDFILVLFSGGLFSRTSN